MRSTSVRCQISIERRQVTQDAKYGTDVETWVPLAAVPGSPVLAERWWADVQDELPSRSEAYKNGLAQATSRMRLRLRWRADIDSAMRVILHGDTDVTYQIIGGPSAIGGRKEKIEIVCERYSTQGGS